MSQFAVIDDRPYLILGAGGHARVVAQLLARLGKQIGGFIAREQVPGSEPFPLMGDDSWLLDQSPSTFWLANGVGGVGDCRPRAEVYERFNRVGFSFPRLVHPQAFVESPSLVECGAQLMLGAIAQIGVRIGQNTIINTGAVIDHDSVIGRNSHIAPGASISGGVEIGDFTHVGTGAVIMQGIKIGSSAVVGAGAVVIRDVPSGSRVAGVPAAGIR